MLVRSEDLEDAILKVQYVKLVVECDAPHLRFQKSTKILVSKRSQFVLIQLDKPVYTPRQTGKGPEDCDLICIVT